MKSKKGSVKYYRKKADKLFSDLIRQRIKCEKCGAKNKVLHTAHIVGRKNLTLRWDPMNALALCLKCHIYWMHKEPLEFTEWFQKKYPIRFEYIMQNKNRLTKRTKQDYIELVRMYEKLVTKRSTNFLTK